LRQRYPETSHKIVIDAYQRQITQALDKRARAMATELAIINSDSQNIQADTTRQQFEQEMMAALGNARSQCESGVAPRIVAKSYKERSEYIKSAYPRPRRPQVATKDVRKQAISDIHATFARDVQASTDLLRAGLK
jgi:hypothetical protein